MNVFQRIKGVLIGLVMIAGALLFLLVEPDVAYLAVLLVLTLGLAVVGIKDIIFFFTMARHMIGGKMILIQGVIILDFALVTASFANVPKIYILLYLIGVHAFSGVIEILRAMEAKRTVEGPWKLKFSHGVVNLALAAACLIFIGSVSIALVIYCAGLIYSAAIRILSSFRRTTFILIE